MKKEKTFLLLGDSPSTAAIGKVLTLFGMVDGTTAGTHCCDMAVMVDGDKFDLEGVKGRFGKNAAMIHVEAGEEDPHLRHPLCFLSTLFTTFKMPIRDFSVVELGRIIDDLTDPGKVEKKDYAPPRTAPIADAVDVIKGLSLSSGDAPGEFAKYMENQQAYIESRLHSLSRKDSKVIEDVKEQILRFDKLFSRLKVPQNIDLNILVVENDPGALQSHLENLKKTFKSLRFFIVKKDFKDFRSKIKSGEPLGKLLPKDVGDFFENDKDKSIGFDKIDLILQDIYLEEKNISGTDLARLYFDVAPQAIVFFLTSMDVETLAASGHDRMVDRIVAKDRIKGLMKYYYDRFNELYGTMLWQVFIRAEERKAGKPQLSDRMSVRRLLANIRTWTMEPKILFHGFALPEMVDHEFRHTSGLWKMTDRILGRFLESHQDAMPSDERMLISLAAWLHDIGHRGDEFHTYAAEIRENHGSISESLILKHYKALGIEWLTDFCRKPAELEKDPCKGLVNRNKKRGCFGGGICPLRVVGLLCRYHQSTAPLKAYRVADLILDLKKPSPYCIIKMKGFRKEGATGEDQLSSWLNADADIDWFSADVRTMDEFDNNKWVRLAGMLRWLDALHTHSEKVGSCLCVESFNAYLYMRREYCKNNIKKIDLLLGATTAGSEAYLKYLGERMRLDEYRKLLDVQNVHQWLSGMVRDIYGEWSWRGDEQKWGFRIIFELFETDPFSHDKKIEEVVSALKDQYEIDNSHEAWAKFVGNKVIGKELKSQTDKFGAEPPFFAAYFKGVPLYYSWRKSGEGLNDIPVK